MIWLRRFLKKVLLLDILKGLWVTLRRYFSRKATIPYPEKVKIPSERFRGVLRLHRNEAGEPLCIACKACQRACGTNCFTIEGERPEGSKTMRPTQFDWKLERCSFCGLCVEVCPTKAIRFSKEFRMATLSKEAFLFHMSDMYVEGPELQKYIRGEDRR